MNRDDVDPIWGNEDDDEVDTSLSHETELEGGGNEFGYLLEEEPAGDETPQAKAAREQKEADEARKREAQKPSLEEQARAVLDQLKQNPEALRSVIREIAPPQPAAAPTKETPPAAQPFDEEALLSDLEAKVLKGDVRGAFREFLNQGRKVLQSEAAKVNANVERTAISNAETVIDNFMEKVKADPNLDPEVAPEMERMINEVRQQNPAGMASATASQIIQGLNMAKETAMGRCLAKNGPPKPRVRSAPAPSYRGGSRATTSGPTRADLPRNDAEKSLVLGLQEAGFDKKVIIEELRDFRRNEEAGTGGARRRRAG